VTGHHQDLFSWYYDAGARKYFVRKNTISPPAEIQSIVPLGKDTLVINGVSRLVWYSLSQEKEIRSESAHEQVTAVAVNGARNEIVYADGNDLVFLGAGSKQQVVSGWQ